MKKFFKQDLKVLVQGATGREGQRAVDFMRKYHTAPLAGVTPGKGGQEVAGIPIFNSVSDARRTVGLLNATSICVPAAAVRSAVMEAVCGGISFVHVLTEGVPYRDLAYIKDLCVAKGVKLLGPGSLGILVVDEGRVGFLGGPDVSYKAGNVSLISRSGGMTNEIAHFLCDNGVGLRAAVHLGAEPVQGTTLTDQIKEFLGDEGTSAIAVFEEVVNNSFSSLIEYLSKHPASKRIYIALAGKSQNIMPAGVPFGHVDVLLKKDETDIKRDLKELGRLGVSIVDSYEQIPSIIN